MELRDYRETRLHAAGAYQVAVLVKAAWSSLDNNRKIALIEAPKPILFNVQAIRHPKPGVLTPAAVVCKVHCPGSPGGLREAMTNQ